MSDPASEPLSDPRPDAAAGELGLDSSSDPDRLLLLSLSDCSESDCRCTLLFFTGRSLPESSSSEPPERRGLPASLPECFLPPSDSLSDGICFLWPPPSSDPEPLSLWCLYGRTCIHQFPDALKCKLSFELRCSCLSSAIFRPSSSDEDSEEEMMALDLIFPLRDGGRRSGCC